MGNNVLEFPPEKIVRHQPLDASTKVHEIGDKIYFNHEGNLMIGRIIGICLMIDSKILEIFVRTPQKDYIVYEEATPGCMNQQRLRRFSGFGGG